MFKSKNATLLILIFVMLVNSISYGIIIPLLYPYAIRFGIDPFGLSILFAAFSLAQFLATPVIGRLSDRFGRKPLLLLCLLGTGLSLALFSLATNFWVLLLARVLDGVTGGNNSVAQAVVADTTDGPERAKGFGMLGAAMGAGFLIGPALGGLLSSISLTAPFWFASGLAIVGTIIGYFVLTESLPPTAKEKVNHEPLFNFKHIYQALFTPVVGLVLLISLLATVAGNMFFIGFQSFTVDILALTPTQTGLLFATFGLVSILMQAVGIRILLQKIPSKKKILLGSLVASGVVLFLISFTRSLPAFAGILFIHMFVGAPQLPMVAALLSERTNKEDQGGLLGINQAYMSVGQIIGPLIAGVVAVWSVPAVFAVAAGVFGVSAIATAQLFKPVKEKFDL